MTFILIETFVKSEVNIVSRLYHSYVSSILEFANPVWTPILQYDIQLCIKKSHENTVWWSSATICRQIIVNWSAATFGAMQQMRPNSHISVSQRPQVT